MTFKASKVLSSKVIPKHKKLTDWQFMKNIFQGYILIMAKMMFIRKIIFIFLIQKKHIEKTPYNHLISCYLLSNFRPS